MKLLFLDLQTVC